MKDRKNIIIPLIFLFVPFFTCFVYAHIHGNGLGNIFFPNSKWNDELFYYKQVETIVKYAYPRGYFGYNENRAILLSFSDWSPATYLPWAFFGMLFGWSLAAPVVYNIIMMSIALLLFALLVKPDIKKAALMLVFYCTCTIYARYMLSIMPETACQALVIIEYAIAINFADKPSKAKLVWMTVIAFFLVLIRPYMILLLALPAFYSFKVFGCRAGVPVCLSGAASMAGYALFSKYLQAAYFGEFFLTEMLQGRGGFGDWFPVVVRMVTDGVTDEYKYIKQFAIDGMAQGGYLLVNFTILALLIICCVKPGFNKQYLPIYVIMTVSFVMMSFSVMYDLTDGTKHLLVFIIVGILLIAMAEDKYYIKCAIMLAVLLYVFVFGKVDHYEYDLPVRTVEAEKKLSYWQDIFSEKLELNYSKIPDFENNIAWDSEADYSVMYPLPAGMGISCVQTGYMYYNFDDLKSRYILTTSDGAIASLCADKHYKKLGEYENAVVYQRY